jgi:hypothetical protein
LRENIYDLQNEFIFSFETDKLDESKILDSESNSSGNKVSMNIPENSDFDGNKYVAATIDSSFWAYIRSCFSKDPAI